MKCTKCDDPKNIEDFAFKNKATGKRSTVCKTCQRAYKRKHYRGNKAAHYGRNKKTNAKLREYTNQVKSSGCVVCGEADTCCLDFHHLRDKDIEVAKMCIRGSLKKVKEEIAKCIVLCANCHRKLHAGVISLPVNMTV